MQLLFYISCIENHEISVVFSETSKVLTVPIGLILDRRPDIACAGSFRNLDLKFISKSSTCR